MLQGLRVRVEGCRFGASSLGLVSPYRVPNSSVAVNISNQTYETLLSGDTEVLSLNPKPLTLNPQP